MYKLSQAVLVSMDQNTHINYAKLPTLKFFNKQFNISSKRNVIGKAALLQRFPRQKKKTNIRKYGDETFRATTKKVTNYH